MLSKLLGLDAGGRRQPAPHKPYELLGEAMANTISNCADDATHGMLQEIKEDDITNLQLRIRRDGGEKVGLVPRTLHLAAP